MASNSINSSHLSPAAQEIHDQLIQIISQQIDKYKGKMRFSDFMQYALYTPELGYYQNCLTKLGDLGDFVTAPELGTLFAYALSQALQSYQAAENISDFNILELGAGNGSLAADLLGYLELANKLPEHYFILEPSASLQSQQYQLIAQKVPQLLNSVSWLSTLPCDFNGIILANEVIDAIPCERIINTEQGWCYLDICINNGSFEWSQGDCVPTDKLPNRLVEKLHNYPLSYQTELRPQIDGWISALENCLSTGNILLFDYGYPEKEFYHPQREQGTLKCFSRHRSHSNPLELVGLQDITAHVDFSALAVSAVKQNLQVTGFTTQAGFLLENGVLEQVETLISHNDEPLTAAHYALSQQLQKLMTPGQMGEVIKVIQLSKNDSRRLSGFSFQDHLYRL